MINNILYDPLKDLPHNDDERGDDDNLFNPDSVVI